MISYVILMWAISIVMLFAYLFSWPRKPTLKEFVLFDGSILFGLALMLTFFFSRPIDPSEVGEVSAWWFAILPLWICIFTIPTLLVAAFVRYWLFRLK